jgi:hypothetical protein
VKSSAPHEKHILIGSGGRRLAANADWQEHWGHPVALVESYVDESQYRGTCYRACGFQAAGLTAGYGRSSRDYYEEHGQPKQLYLRELRPRALGILRQGRLPADLAEHEERVSGPCPLRATHLGSLLEVFEQFKDKRRGHGLRHRQAFVLACAAVAMLMGAGGYEAFEDKCSKLTHLGVEGTLETPPMGARPEPSAFIIHRALAAERFEMKTILEPSGDADGLISANELVVRRRSGPKARQRLTKLRRSRHGRAPATSKGRWIMSLVTMPSSSRIHLAIDLRYVTKCAPEKRFRQNVRSLSGLKPDMLSVSSTTGKMTLAFFDVFFFDNRNASNDTLHPAKAF